MLKKSEYIFVASDRLGDILFLDFHVSPFSDTLNR